MWHANSSYMSVCGIWIGSLRFDTISKQFFLFVEQKRKLNLQRDKIYIIWINQCENVECLMHKHKHTCHHCLDMCCVTSLTIRIRFVQCVHMGWAFSFQHSTLNSQLRIKLHVLYMISRKKLDINHLTSIDFVAGMFAFQLSLMWLLHIENQINR